MAAKKKTAKPYGNKTKFVMGLPRDLPAKQVVEKAKQQGIVISEAHVYKIRSTNKGKTPASRASAGASGRSSAKGTPSAPKGRASSASASSSKRDFVLSFPPTTPASEILRKAKDSGIGLSKAYLYTIRNAAGAKPAGRGRGAAPASSARAARAAAASTPRARSNGSLESQFIDAALDLGLSRASEILDRVRSRLKDL
jgi:hypothetical protein